MHAVTWRTLWWGSERPTAGRVASVVGLLVSMLLGMLGMFVDFIPASGLYGGAAAATFFIIGLALSLALLLRASANGRLRHAAQRSWLKTALGIAFLPVMVGFLLWSACIKALPWAFTRAFGQTHAIQAMVRTDHTSSRRSCDYRIKGGPLDDTFPGFLCIGQAYYAAHPDREVVVSLGGKRTALGFAITSVRHVSDGAD